MAELAEHMAPWEATAAVLVDMAGVTAATLVSDLAAQIRVPPPLAGK